uniref:Uncharacterized protein n=1 Tax=Ixodes ricinus TaxID=34613 RepID=V5I365_IXORI
MSLFGAIVTGRLVQTDFQTIDQTKFLMNIPDPASINHIVVFLTGAQPFPEGLGGSVYFSWPSPDAVGNWQYLGFISNEKPSAIFKVSKHKEGKPHRSPEQRLCEPADATATGLLFKLTASHVFTLADAQPEHAFSSHGFCSVAQLGISVEPLAQIQFQAAPAATASPLDSSTEFCTKMLESLFNHLASYGGAPVTPAGDTFFPMRALEQWHSNFQRRLQQNPNFWRNQ